MLMEESKLRWWGIDMRPRRRRRIAVVLTALVWFIGTISIEDRLASRPYLCLLTLLAASAFLKWISVFRTRGLVKRFEDTHPSAPSASWEIVEGLDGWAQYRYGAASFDAATPEQQNDLLNRHRLGKFLVPKKNGVGSRPFDPDEREAKERDGVERWSAKLIALLIATQCGRYAEKAADHEAVKASDVMAIFFMLTVFTWSLNTARVLWTEPDPRTSCGEISALEPA